MRVRETFSHLFSSFFFFVFFCHSPFAFQINSHAMNPFGVLGGFRVNVCARPDICLRSQRNRVAYFRVKVERKLHFAHHTRSLWLVLQPRWLFTSFFQLHTRFGLHRRRILIWRCRFASFLPHYISSAFSSVSEKNNLVGLQFLRAANRKRHWFNRSKNAGWFIASESHEGKPNLIKC